MSSLPPDPWKVLGLEKSADKAEVRSAYKKLVLKCHPDKVQDPALKAEKQDEFQKVQQAYELLNNDAERTKYEEQIKLHELRKQAAMMSKNMPNSSAARTPSKQHYSYEVRTAEPRDRRPPPPGGASGPKMYSYSSSHTRSHEEMPTRAYHAMFEDEERRARRAASAEYSPKPSKRDDERRDKDERRRKREKEQQRILEEIEREAREKEARRQERKARERALEKDRRNQAEEKARRHKPYVEDLEQDEQKVYSIRTKDKKPTSTKKIDDVRDKSASRRERAESPRVEPTARQAAKDVQYMEFAANYIERSGGRAPAFGRSQTFQEPPTYSNYPPVVPTPPPADDEEPRRSSARRRGSHDTPKSKDKSSSHKKSSREFEVVDVTPTQKAIPTFAKTTSAPPVVPESPPRVNRSMTAQEPYSRPVPQGPPAFSRTHTWGQPGEEVERDRPRRPSYGAYDYDSDEDRPRHHRSSRKHEATRYKVDGVKTSKMDSYGYGESPTSRRYMPDVVEARSPPHDYSSTGFKVKETKAYGYGDVKYSDVPHAYREPYSAYA